MSIRLSIINTFWDEFRIVLTELYSIVSLD